MVTPNLEHTPDGVQLGYRPRVPLLIFGGPVKQTVDARWNGHTSIGKTVLELFGLSPLGVPRLDTAPSLVDRVDTTTKPANPPPTYRTAITQPAPPTPTPPATPAPPPPTGTSVPVGPVLMRDGSTLPPPNDQPVS